MTAGRYAGIAIGLLACAVGLTAQSAPRKATAVIIGMVGDTNLHPIVGADVNFAGSAVRATTDSLGRFQVVRAPAGKFLLIVRSIGYRPATEPIELGDDDTLRLAFTLERTVHELGVVLVTERTVSRRLLEFNERRKAGAGEFFTQGEIEAMNLVGVKDILRRAKSVRISPGGNSALSAREVAPCPMAIYVDGVPLGAIDLNYLPSPKEIAGIEVYAGAATLPLWLPVGPPNARKGCGAILIWTRDGSS